MPVTAVERIGGKPAAVTVTIDIPLTGESLPPQARRLLEVVRELVQAGDAVAQIEDAPAPAPGSPAKITLLLASRQMLVGGELLPMTRLEFDLVQFLADHPRRVFSRAQLLTGVWGYEHTGERTVDVHVRRIRVKLGTVPLITTVYGVGYRLADDASIVVRPHE
ncbi:winged helix-turn-helix domain-containing protein [Symbioplanes lichenis]|uniref:winged helix-turn-helix domain-containing protein n=1 Tax=Symbioplanes lichenis TaxID=1629072 RepID=UPI002738BCB1|nr:winged helix-turn-helix domain-containing protein [Actinoplanes lichenis]